MPALAKKEGWNKAPKSDCPQSLPPVAPTVHATRQKALLCQTL